MKRPAQKPPSKVLVFLHGGIGEAVRTSPVLEILKRRHPRTRVTVMGTSSGQGRILLGTPWADGFVYLKSAEGKKGADTALTLLDGLRLLLFMYLNDLVIFSIEPSAMGKVVAGCAKLCRRKQIVLYDPSLDYTQKYGCGPALLFHTYQRELVAQLGADGGDAPELPVMPNVVPSQRGEHIVDEFLDAHGLKSFAIIAPEASTVLRSIPAEQVRYARMLFRDQDLKVVMLAGPRDTVAFGKDDIVFRHPDIKVIASLISRAYVVMSGDSAIAQISAAFGVNTIVLFGPTSGMLYSPFVEKSMYIIEKSCSSRDQKGACERCVHKTYREGQTGGACLTWIDPDELMTATDQF